jgi:hypothetical protein
VALGAPTVPIANAIVTQRFEIVTELRGNEVLLRLDTDLPATAKLIWTISRHYWRREHGESVEYSVIFYSEKVTASKAAQPVSIEIADAVFNQKLADAKATAQIFDDSFTVEKVSDDIEVEAVVGLTFRGSGT